MKNATSSLPGFPLDEVEFPSRLIPDASYRLPEKRHKLRVVVNLGANVIKLYWSVNYGFLQLARTVNIGKLFQSSLTNKL